MKTYVVRLATINWDYTYEEVEALDLKEFSTKVRELLKLHPGKCLVDFEVKGFNL